MQKKALYDHGHLLFLDQDLPSGRMEVMVNFPDHVDNELSDEWKAEIDRRLETLENGSANLVDADDFVQKRLSTYAK